VNTKALLHISWPSISSGARSTGIDTTKWEKICFICFASNLPGLQHTITHSWKCQKTVFQGVQSNAFNSAVTFLGMSWILPAGRFSRYGIDKKLIHDFIIYFVTTCFDLRGSSSGTNNNTNYKTWGIDKKPAGLKLSNRGGYMTSRKPRFVKKCCTITAEWHCGTAYSFFCSHVHSACRMQESGRNRDFLLRLRCGKTCSWASALKP
jgi:hypothetical protein